MKSLSLSRPLLIMLIGLPGSGKSFFARQFASTFNAPLISVDFIRHTLVPESNYTPEEDEVIGELAEAQLTELLKTERTIIIDGGVNTTAGRQSVVTMAQKHNYGVLLIWVQTDEMTAEYRSTRRNKRRKGDELNSPMQPDTFAASVQAFERPTKREDFVVVSGKHTFATQVRVVLKKIVAPREGAVVKTPLVVQGIRPHTPNTSALSQQKNRPNRNLRVS